MTATPETIAVLLEAEELGINYQLLLEAEASMTVEGALQILGYRPTDNPTPDQLKQSRNARVMANHPDHGGSDDAVRDVIAAYLFLNGRGHTRSQPIPNPQQPPQQQSTQPKPQQNQENTKTQNYSAAFAQEVLKNIKDRLARNQITREQAEYEMQELLNLVKAHKVK